MIHTMASRAAAGFLLTWALVCGAWIQTALGQQSNSQLLSLITSQLPSGQQTPIANFRTVLDAMVNSTNVSGTSCPAGTAISPYQPWANTTSAPAGVLLNVFDGANCVPWALLNTNTHALTLLGSAQGSPAQNIVGRFGSMDLFQRGAGNSASIAVAASATIYTVDGCYLATGSSEASTVAVVTGIATGSNKAVSIARNSSQSGTAQVTFGCPMDTDEITQARGSNVVLSFWVEAGANWSPVSGAITANVLCGTASVTKQVNGYSNQSTVATLSQNLTPGGAAQRLQVTSASAVPANCTQMEVQWTWAPTGSAGAADSVIIDSVQLEVAAGPQAVASPFQSLDFDSQLRMAQRHYAKTFPYSTAPAQNAGVTGALMTMNSNTAASTGLQWLFPRKMRVTPIITTYNPSSTNANCHELGTSAADRTISVDPDTATSADQIIITCAAGGTAGDRVYVHAQADAGI